MGRTETDPIGGGDFATDYFYVWDTANWYPTRTIETRADGGKHTVDWNPQGDPFQHLRQKESWTDTDGTTLTHGPQADPDQFLNLEYDY